MVLQTRKQIEKEVDLMFTVTDGIPFWGMGDHETMIVALVLPIATLSGWKGPCTIRGSDLESAMVRSLDI